MSSYYLTAYKKTADGVDPNPVTILALDNYFRHHVYGYREQGTEKVMTEEEFKRGYEIRKTEEL